MNTSSLLVSIIVPVYNAQLFLHRCIDSIISQSWLNWELLLINDGSTDRSGDICVDYALKDNRIKVFHQTNKGVSSARNVGLDNAKGEYVVFCDSDDWVEKDWIKTMLLEAIANNADIVYCDSIYHYSEENRVVVPSIEAYDTKEAFFKKYLIKGYALWLIMVRRNLYVDNHLRGLEGYIFCEDLYLSVILFLHAQKISHISKPLYNYNCANPNSLVATQKMPSKYIRNIYEGISVIELLILLFQHHELYDSLEEQLGWSMLKAKVGLIFIKEKRNEYNKLYPEFDRYIDTNPLTSNRIKKVQKLMKFPCLWWIIDVGIVLWKKVMLGNRTCKS